MNNKKNPQSLFDALAECVLDDRTTKNDAAVYVTLLTNARGTTSRPSRKRIARDAGINYVNVSRHTRKLESLGYITSKHTKGRHTNIYGLERLSDMGVIPATVEYSLVTPLNGSDMGINSDTPHEAHMGVTSDTQYIRASSNNNFSSPSAEQADAPHKRGQDAGPTEQKSQEPPGKDSMHGRELFPTSELQRLWNERKLENWAYWRATPPKLQEALPASLEVMRGYREKMDAAAVVEIFDFLVTVPLFSGKKLKDDGTVFFVTPAYIFGNADRLDSILNGAFSNYGIEKPRAHPRLREL